MKGTGKALIDIEKATAGQPCVFTITYETGSYGIDDSGEIIIARRDVCDSAIPQFDNPLADGYVSVTSESDVTLAVSYVPTRYIRPWKAAISIRVRDGSLHPGEKVYIRFGDNRGPGYRMQTFPEAEHIFRVMVDCAGSGNFQDIENTPVIVITGGRACMAEGCFPSTVKPGQKFNALARVLDCRGNIADSFSGRMTMSIDGTIMDADIMDGICEIKNLQIDTPGTHRPSFIESCGLPYSCNPIICSSSHSNILWGDMHGQTKETVGTGNPDLYFTFARDKAFLDFSAWQGNDFQVTDETWKDINEKVKKYNEPGKFVCFLGYEWSGTTPVGGDHNIYFLGDDEVIHRSYRWQIGMDESDGSSRSPISALWEEFAGRKDVMAIPHVGGRYGNFDFYNPDFIPVVEIHSHHGSFEWFFRDALAMGLKPGIIAASDDHSCRPGLSFPTEVSSRGGFVSFDVKGGYTAVFADELTREAIWNAIMARHCYGTSGERMIASFNCGDYSMGDEFETESPPVLDIDITGTDDIRDLYVMRNLEQVFRLNDTRPRDFTRVYIEWSGVRVKSRAKKNIWEGSISVNNGSIKGLYEYNNQKRPGRCKMTSPGTVSINSATSGDTDGIEIELETNPGTTITVDFGNIVFSFPVSELADGYIIHDCGGVNLEVRAGHPPLHTQKAVSLQFIDTNIQPGTNAYWVKAVQNDGHTLWTSPMYINFSG
ncbi:MAG TPA: DUF3604 domain-containing protein [Clostridia bacterium]|nr:DUF3604 domain-containing protein [Clostridia bacterium]